MKPIGKYHWGVWLDERERGWIARVHFRLGSGRCDPYFAETWRTYPTRVRAIIAAKRLARRLGLAPMPERKKQ